MAQGAQVELEVAPVALDQVPAGQGRHSGGEGEGVGKLDAGAGNAGKGVPVDEVGGKYSQTYPDTNPDSYVSIKSFMQILPP